MKCGREIHFNTSPRQAIEFRSLSFGSNAHLPFTNWEDEDPEIFTHKHHQILSNHHAWIIEDNYSRLMPVRFAQATSIIGLDFNRWGSVYRYIKRTLKNESYRPGQLEGAENRFNLFHIFYTLFHAPKNRPVYENLIQNCNAQVIRIASFKDLIKIYAQWELKRYIYSTFIHKIFGNE